MPALQRRADVPMQHMTESRDTRAGRLCRVQRKREGLAVDSTNTSEIPDVFRRTPMATLHRYAQHGVTGAKQELCRRRAEQQKKIPKHMIYTGPKKRIRERDAGKPNS
jgi:hypothetical protein